MTKIMGLCRGRHQMPVEEYVFEDSIEDPMNIGRLYAIADDMVTSDIDHLYLYLTGLGQAYSQVVKVCEKKAISLTVKYYDLKEDRYVDDDVLSFETCAFCKRRMRKGSWYCPNCGAT